MFDEHASFLSNYLAQSPLHNPSTNSDIPTTTSNSGFASLLPCCTQCISHTPQALAHELATDDMPPSGNDRATAATPSHALACAMLWPHGCASTCTHTLTPLAAFCCRERVAPLMADRLSDCTQLTRPDALLATHTGSVSTASTCACGCADSSCTTKPCKHGALAVHKRCSSRVSNQGILMSGSCLRAHVHGEQVVDGRLRP